MFKFGKFSQIGLQSMAFSNASMNIWEGPVRSGKTIDSLVRWSEFCRFGPPGKFVMVGKTEGTLQRNIISVLADILGNAIRYTRQKAFIYGREIDLVGANDIRSESKIRGGTYAAAYVDEATLVPQNFWEMLTTRLSVIGAKLFATTNPDSLFHYLKTDYIDRKEEPDMDLKVFSYKLEDNLNLSETFVNLLKNRYKGMFYERFILGLWVLAQGLIYSMFNRKQHVFSDIDTNSSTTFNASIDYGAQNPFAIGLYTDKIRPTLLLNKKIFDSYMIKEYYYSGKTEENIKTNEEYATDLNEFVGNRKIGKIFCDPSAISFITTVKKDYPKLGAKFVKTDNAVKEGIESVSSVLGQNRLFIHKDCKETLKEFSVYSWNEKKAKSSGVEEPIKENDHSMDQLRYFVHNHMMKVSRLDGWGLSA